MDYRSSTSRYILTVLAIILLITTFILVGLNAFDIQGRFGTGKSYKDGFLAARAMYSRICPIAGTGLVVKSVSGVVVSVGTNSFVIKQDSLGTNEQVDGVSDMRTIQLAAGAKISTYTRKSAEQIQKDFEAFQKAQQTAKQLTLPPTTVVEQTLKLSDIKVGQHVTVTSNTDVRMEDVITATAVTVQ